jgi:AcrR family transcriptional regulator
MSPTERRSASERREEILAASMALFSRHGLHGVTTRMIADAAGISEALLYRHFKGKEELYTELQRACMRGTIGAAEKLAALEPSTATLVRSVYFIVRQIAGAGDANTCSLKRMMLSSLIGDGDFARGFLESHFQRFIPKLVACVEAAKKSGDLEDRGRHADIRLWLVHHVAVMASNMRLPERPVVDYGVDPDVLVEEITRFALRGLGLKEETITRHFVPKNLAAFLTTLIAAGPNKEKENHD